MGQPGIEQRPLKMINGITREFGEVLFDGARVDAANMVGQPGEGWRLAMTVVSHEREPGELGYVARYGKLANELVHRVRADPARDGVEQRRDLALGAGRGRHVALPREPSAFGPARRDRPRPRGLGGQAPHDVVRAGRRPRRLAVGGVAPAGEDDTWLKAYLYSRAQSVMGGTSQIQRNLVATRILEMPAS